MADETIADLARESEVVALLNEFQDACEAVRAASDMASFTSARKHRAFLRAEIRAAMLATPRAPECPRCDKAQRALDTVYSDLAEILLALGLGDHARSSSGHEVVQREVLPAIRRLAESGRRA